MSHAEGEVEVVGVEAAALGAFPSRHFGLDPD